MLRLARRYGVRSSPLTSTSSGHFACRIRWAFRHMQCGIQLGAEQRPAGTLCTRPWLKDVPWQDGTFALHLCFLDVHQLCDTAFSGRVV